MSSLEMAEGAKVRLVRCPKCEKLLAEHPDYPVYRCGGCDATLQVQVQQQMPDMNVSPEKSVNGRVRVCEKSESLSEKKGKFSSEKTMENDPESDLVEFRRKEGVLNSNISSSSKGEVKEHLSDYNLKYRRFSKAPVDNCVVVPNADSNPYEFTKTNVEENRESNFRTENVSGAQKFRGMPSSVVRRTPRTAVEGSRFSPYPDEGPSNRHLDSAYHCDELIKNWNPDGSDRVEYLNQAEILRKIDELREQLTQSCDLLSKPKERVPSNSRMVHPNSCDGQETRFSESLPTLNRRRHPHFNGEPIPLMNRNGIDIQCSYPPLDAQNDILGYGDPFAPRILRGRTPSQSRQFTPRPCMEIEPFPHNSLYHKPSCSCYHCYNAHWQVPSQVPPAVFCNQRFPDTSANHMFYHFDGPSTFGFQSYNRRCANRPMDPHEPHLHMRRPSDLESDLVDFRGSRLRRALFTKGNLRYCRPVSGGAPFIICYHCFELLHLPRKLMLVERSRYKLRCGACSKTVTFALDGKRFAVSVPAAQTKNVATGVDSDSSDVMREGLYSHDRVNHLTIDSYSDDYEDSMYNIQYMDTEPILSSFPITNHNAMENEHGLNLSDSENMEGLTSFSSTSVDEESPISMTTQRVVSNSTELPIIADVISPVPGSPPHEDLGYCSSKQIGSKFAKGSRSKRTDQEKVVPIPTKGTFKQNSVKDASVATEMDFSYNEYSNLGVSQDSGEVTIEEDQPKTSKGGDSFFTGLIKKSFRDLTRFNHSLENSKSNVSVNDEPIPDRLIKKAEKQAGPIYPGQYWYDYRAGFWGVMGQPCLGIIPPFIEEFNYPMPRNCAAGNTGILVNGRELHHKDLDLLAGRGLPETRDKSYIVEISGRVFDEASGEELDALGKLAPTVEKVKHGFGMRVLSHAH